MDQRGGFCEGDESQGPSNTRHTLGKFAMPVKFIRSVEINYIEITGTIEAETKAAILLDDGVKKVWLPKSQLEDIDIQESIVVVRMPEWLAIDRDGLEYWCRGCKADVQKRNREKRAMEKNPAPLPKKQKSGNGRRRQGRRSSTTLATPDEIINALKIGIRKEAADEIFVTLGKTLSLLRERFA